MKQIKKPKIEIISAIIYDKGDESDLQDQVNDFIAFADVESIINIKLNIEILQRLSNTEENIFKYVYTIIYIPKG